MNNQPLNNSVDYARYKYIIENIKDVIWELDPKMYFTFVSPTAYAMSGYTAEEMVGCSILEFLTPESKAQIRKQWERTVPKRIDSKYTATILYDVQFLCKNGTMIWCEVCAQPIFKNNEFIGYIGTTRDVSEKKIYENDLKRYFEELGSKNKQLEDLANLDMLTGIYNRRKFESFVDSEIEKKKRFNTPFSIIMFDIDSFKEINDNNGHKKGDKILQDITVLVKNTLRISDILFRWGGDEFIILLPGLTIQKAFIVADRIKEAICLYKFEIQNAKVTVSLGVGEYITGEDLDQFVTRVDNALLKAKANGKNMVELS